MSPSAGLAHRWPKPLAKRKGAHPPLPTVTAPIRTRKACAFRCYTTSQNGPPRPQARAAPAQGLRLPGKRPPYLPRPSSARATRTLPRCLDADGRLRTPPRGEYLKVPAKTAARVPPDQQRHARPTASSYRPSLPLPAAICRSPCSSCLAHPNNLDLTSRCDLLRGSCKINWVLTSVSIEATLAAGRDASVTREISWSSRKKSCYASICWAPLKHALRIGLSGSLQRRPLRFCATWLLREAGTQGEGSPSFCGQRATSNTPG